MPPVASPISFKMPTERTAPDVRFGSKGDIATWLNERPFTGSARADFNDRDGRKAGVPAHSIRLRFRTEHWSCRESRRGRGAARLA